MEGRELPESLGRLSGEDDAADFSGTVPIAGGVMEEKTLEDGTVELIKHFDEDVEPEVVKVGRDKRTERRPSTGFCGILRERRSRKFFRRCFMMKTCISFEAKDR